MAQSVFYVGNPITSRLKLGIVPDISTTATVSVTRPDGTPLAGPQITLSGWQNVDEMTAQWWTTDDGSPSGATLHAVGDWLAVWNVTGTGASVTPKVYPVRLLPSASDDRTVWAPLLSDVADHVPFLTANVTVPGTQLWLGTFTGNTRPTDEQAQRHIDGALAVVSGRVGTLSATLYPLGRTVVALRAAASILRAFARNNDDRLAAADLDARADAAYAQLIDGTEATSTTPATGPVPVGFFPDPVIHGDWNL